MANETALHVDYLTPTELAARPAAWWQGVLGVAAFDTPAPPLPAADIPLAEIKTPVLGEAADRLEVWRTDSTVQWGRRGRIRYGCSEDALFGCMSIAETDAGPQPSEDGPTRLHRATDLAYREVFSAIDQLGMAHLARVWNYLPEINRESDGSERYWQFNSGRQDAFLACGRAVSGAVPAACALGSPTGGPLVIYFLASRNAPQAIENPRQVAAYRYPDQYGPRSPTFSRACVSDLSSGQILFISGTASILGHQTVHVGDAAAQTRETLRNVEALIAEASRVARAAGRFMPSTLTCKVYVRERENFPVIETEMRRGLGSSARIIYLQAELCRRDLLVEIEATGCYPSGGSP